MGHQEACKICGGSGQVGCTSCLGSGEARGQYPLARAQGIIRACEVCGGSGSVVCARCEGLGSLVFYGQYD